MMIMMMMMMMTFGSRAASRGGRGRGRGVQQSRGRGGKGGKCSKGKGKGQAKQKQSQQQAPLVEDVGGVAVAAALSATTATNASADEKCVLFASLIESMRRYTTTKICSTGGDNNLGRKKANDYAALAIFASMQNGIELSLHAASGVKMAFVKNGACCGSIASKMHTGSMPCSQG